MNLNLGKNKSSHNEVMQLTEEQAKEANKLILEMLDIFRTHLNKQGEMLSHGLSGMNALSDGGKKDFKHRIAEHNHVANTYSILAKKLNEGHCLLDVKPRFLELLYAPKDGDKIVLRYNLKDTVWLFLGKKLLRKF